MGSAAKDEKRGKNRTTSVEANELQPLNYPSTQAEPLKHHHFSTKNSGVGLNHYYLYPESSYLRQDS
ncbi:hypothetical protein Pmani_036837 [Petrolisthes manimaculis]|uniref:Uncharacterized protein n=1 Tax=Petrolisthes manimaculis TaxID=1843537 RepID=A0AAE1TMA4_9EUCA|nr:hypothetical protein Pmani_036837 [Petrolisthes manimaculis]